MSDHHKKKKARFIKPPNLLKSKVGMGGIDENVLDKAQHFIASNPLDFEPFARQYLKDLETALAKIKTDGLEGFAAVQPLIRPVMELKANGGMFQYQLVSEISDVVLTFLESLHDLNADALAVIDVHQKTLAAIIGYKLKGHAGPEGAALVRELSNACERYHKKHSAKTKPAKETGA